MGGGGRAALVDPAARPARLRDSAPFARRGIVESREQHAAVPGPPERGARPRDEARPGQRRMQHIARRIVVG